MKKNFCAKDWRDLPMVGKYHVRRNTFRTWGGKYAHGYKIITPSGWVKWFCLSMQEVRRVIADEQRLLEPLYDGRKSFYGKATVMVTPNGNDLYSYGTLVARIVATNHGYRIAPYAEVYGTYSPTTLRHIKEFLRQNGFRADTKAQIERDYCVRNFTRKG